MRASFILSQGIAVSYRRQVTETDITLEPERPADAAVIWLHGLGADGNDFVSVVPELRLPAEAAVRFVFPHAPVRPVTINNGMAMRAWYDIVALSRSGPEDADGIEDSARRIAGLLDAQREQGIDARRLVLAGFSQGGAIALHTGLRYPHRLGGVLALSTYLPLNARLAGEAHDANRDTPILMCHGSLDPMVPMALGQTSRDLLQAQNYRVDWRDYPMQHQVCMEEIEHISAWLATLLRPTMPEC